MELISSTGLFSKGCFYDDHCVYRGKKYNYSEMTSVYACGDTIITNEKIELSFFYGTNKLYSIPFDSKHINNLSPVYKHIKEFQAALKLKVQTVDNVDDFELLNFNVTGTSYKQKEINNFFENFSDLEDYMSEYYNATKKTIIDDYYYDTKIYKYEDVLVPKFNFVAEPENEFDVNAIKVMICDDCGIFHHAGYIPKDINIRFGEILANDGILDVECSINGGVYKYVTEDGETSKRKDGYFISIVARYKQ